MCALVSILPTLTFSFFIIVVECSTLCHTSHSLEYLEIFVLIVLETAHRCPTHQIVGEEGASCGYGARQLHQAIANGTPHLSPIGSVFEIPYR